MLFSKMVWTTLNLQLSSVQGVVQYFLYDSAKVHSSLYIFIVMCKEEFLRDIYTIAPSKLWLKKNLVVDKLLQ